MTGSHPFPQPFGNRWYDHIPFVPQAVNLSSTLPLDVQALLGEAFNEHINQYIYQKKNRGELCSLGIAKAMGLYRASHRQRWHDNEASLRRAFNMMVALPDEKLSDFSARMVHVALLVQKEGKALSATADPFSGESNKPFSILGEAPPPRANPYLFSEIGDILEDPEVPTLIQRAGELRLIPQTLITDFGLELEDPSK